jgi:ElaB/YqjD/DUF883 family membrane-anchored ribosome-binding protein
MINRALAEEAPSRELFARGDVLCSGFHRKFRQFERHKMTTRAAKSAAADEITAIEDLMGDLEKRLRRLSGTARREASGATGEVGDFVREALDRIMNRVRDSTAGVTHSVTEEAARFGTDAFKKLTDEVENRPLVMLGVAAGLGFLVGLANRR